MLAIYVNLNELGVRKREENTCHWRDVYLHDTERLLKNVLICIHQHKATLILISGGMNKHTKVFTSLQPAPEMSMSAKIM